MGELWTGAIGRVLALAALTAAIACHATAARVDFVATHASDVATGYFEWDAASPIFASYDEGAGHGKTLWSISGAITLFSASPAPMTNVVLEVMNDAFIDASVPNTLIGDQITLFGTAGPGSGLASVQNFYFRDETGLLLNAITQPTSQADFVQFVDARADLFLQGAVGPTTFDIRQWVVAPAAVSEPGTLMLLTLAAPFALALRRRALGARVAH